jgi:hypothetical protein
MSSHKEDTSMPNQSQSELDNRDGLWGKVPRQFLLGEEVCSTHVWETVSLE